MVDELRTQVERMLRGDGAHATYEDVLRTFPSRWAGERIPDLPHTPWQLLEHLRIAQWDILEWSRDPSHESPAFPAGYWPKAATPDSEQDWKRSVNAFMKDLEAMIAMVREAPDPCASIPHTEGVSLLRETLLLADHNSYHLGQLVQLRRAIEAKASPSG